MDNESGIKDMSGISSGEGNVGRAIINSGPKGCISSGGVGFEMEIS